MPSVTDNCANILLSVPLLWPLSLLLSSLQRTLRGGLGQGWLLVAGSWAGSAAPLPGWQGLEPVLVPAHFAEVGGVWAVMLLAM